MPRGSTSRAGAIRGDLIKWAREEQRLTMRWVSDHGGPSLGYQSEVESMQKTEIRWDKLTTWLKALNVTEAFARGAIPRYSDNPTACRGLAADIGLLIRERAQEFVDLSYNERARQVLCLIARESPQLQRVVLAHVLGLELFALDAYMAGQLAFLPHLVSALSDLTLLPETFFSFGEIDGTSFTESENSRYAIAVKLAIREGLTPEDLIDLIMAARKPFLDAVKRATR